MQFEACNGQAGQDLRLFQQQQRKIVAPRRVVGRGDGGHQRMTRVDLKDRLGSAAALLLRQQALQFAVRPEAAGDRCGNPVFGAGAPALGDGRVGGGRPDAGSCRR